MADNAEPLSGILPKWNDNEANLVTPSGAQQSNGWPAAPTQANPSSGVRNHLETFDAKWIVQVYRRFARDWKTATLYLGKEMVFDPTTEKLYKANVEHTSTGATLGENDLANWDVVSPNINDLLGPFVDGEMVAGDTATGLLKKSTVISEINDIIANDPGIINGNFEHWQAEPTTVPDAPSGTFAADLFRYTKNGPMFHDIGRTIDVPLVSDGAQAGVNFSMVTEVTTANTGLDASEFTAIDYFMEGFDFATYFGKTFTLTFFVKSDVAGTYAVSFRNGDFTRSFIAEYTVEVGDVGLWKKKTVTVTHDTTGTWFLDQNLGMSISFTLAGGSNLQTPAGSWVNGSFLTATSFNFDSVIGREFRITQVSMNLGATGRNNLKDTAGELQRIAKHFKVLNSVKYGFFKTLINESFAWYLPFQRSMRANPLVTVSAEFPTGQVGSPAIDQITINGLAITLTSTGATDQNVNNVFTLTLDSRIDP